MTLLLATTVDGAVRREVPPGRVAADSFENGHPTEVGCAYQIAGRAIRFRNPDTIV